MYSGSIVALVTPFKDYEVDYSVLRQLVQWHIANGTQAIVACGSTGEAMFLDDDERAKILKTCLKAAAGQVPIIMGCGGISTVETVKMAVAAKNDGADAILVVTPCYVKPKAAGILEHYRRVTEAAQLPMILYNNPGRTVADMSVELICEIAKLPNVVGLKDSNNDLGRVIDFRERLGDSFALLCGDDPVTVGYMAYGGNGCISVTANIAPHLCQDLMEAWFNNDVQNFPVLRSKLHLLSKAMFVEANPTPVKYAMQYLGLCSGELRLPLVPVAPESEKVIEHAINKLNLSK